MEAVNEGRDISPARLPQLCKVFIKIRAEISRLKAAHETKIKELEAQKDKVAKALDEYCVSQGVKSVKTDGGHTFYRKVNTRYFIPEGKWDEFFKFCAENNLPELIQKRTSATNIKEYLEDPANKDVVIPALQADSNYTLSVRKAKGT